MCHPGKCSALVQARASGVLVVDDADVAAGRCVETWLRDDDELDEFVKRGLSGDDMVDTRAADDEDEMLRTGCLRKTRAGGNWLTGGMMKFVVGYAGGSADCSISMGIRMSGQASVNCKYIVIFYHTTQDRGTVIYTLRHS
jgi:hypothetical protein